MTESRDTAGVIAPPPLIALAAVLLGLVLDRLLPAFVLILLLSFAERIVIGILLFAAGSALAVAGTRAFHRAKTVVSPFKPAQSLATRGIYTYLRNPMYVGLAFIIGGIGVALASDWTLVMLVPAMLLIHYGVVVREERYLEAKFGDAYRGYKAQVPRYGWPG